MLAAALLGLCPARPGEATEPRRITVTGEGQVSVRPDVARIELGVRTGALSVGQAMAQNRAAMQQVLAALRGLGIEERDIATAHFSLHYEQPPPRPEGAGQAEGKYYVDNMVRVTIRDLDAVDAALEAATGAGADQVWGVHFAVDQEEKAASQARKLAASQARARAEELAGLHGARLGAVLSIEELEESHGGPMPMRAAVMREGGMTSAGELDFSVRLQVVYAIE